jgi:hypothetical protein
MTKIRNFLTLAAAVLGPIAYVVIETAGGRLP